MRAFEDQGPTPRDAAEDGVLEPATLVNSPRYVLARYVSDLPAVAVAMFGSLTWIAGWADPWRTIVQILLAVWVLSLVLHPTIRWRTARFHVSSEGIQAETGLLSRRSESLPWDLVTSVDHRQSWVFQRLGVTEVVCAQTGEDGSRIRLDGLSSADLALFQRHADAAAALPARVPAAAVEEAVPTSDGDAADDQHAVVHRMTLVDLLLLGVVYGQVLLLVPPLAFGLLEVTDALGLTDRLEAAFVSGLGSWPTAVLIVGLAVLVGLAATVLKYHGFTVESQHDGRLRIHYGLFSTHERLITPNAVQGVVWHRNAVEQLLGRARVSVLTLDSATQLGGNLVLPSMPVHRAGRIVAEHLPEFAGSERRLSTGVGAAVLNLTSLLLLAAVVGGAWTLTARTWGWPWFVAAAVCAGTAAIATIAVAVLTSRLFAEPSAGRLIARRITVSERVTAVRAARLHAISTLHLHHRRSSAGRGTAWLPTVHYFAGAPRRAVALCAAPHVVEAIQHMVQRESVPLRA